MKKLLLASHAGFCFGVKRAADLAEKTISEQKKTVYMLGELIHNTAAIDEFFRKGLKTVEDINGLQKGDTIIIRAHGVSRAKYEQLEKAGLNIVDATCPCVAAIHRKVEKADAAGRITLIIGSPEHPEIQGIAGRCENARVFRNYDEIEIYTSSHDFNADMPYTLVAQTTMEKSGYDMCINLLQKVCTNIEIFDTICNATIFRQAEAKELSRSADAVVVIGDKKSTNTAKLVSICLRECENVLFVQNADELDTAWLRNSDVVAITAGASTPAWIIKEVVTKMSDEIITFGENSESFAEMLEQNLKTLHNGEKVIGIVTAVSGTEIVVDLGTKHSGFVSQSEYTDDPSAKLEDLVKIGDEIELMVIKVNDSEGTATLSKKRLESIKGREIIAKAFEDGTPLEGIVVEENRGGVVAVISGVQVFIPASQTGIPRSGSLSELLKKKVKIRISDVNYEKRRIVGSIRSASGDERRANADKIWETLEVGNTYEGTVKSLTDYGVFVDIGGIDGMVHISELSWEHVKRPSDVVTAGDKLNVRIIKLDTEKRKISLSCKNSEDDPWIKFTEGFKVGDIVNVKIARFMPFGAFAEIIPGVDGLIHISQICSRRISRPAEVLTIGQEAEVKITEINNETKKVGLSYKAVAEPEFADESES